MHRSPRHGFSLVEMSIVLVIIGLLTGGILAGKNMIRNARMQGVIADYIKYVDAVNAFRTQYKGLPGDLPNATSYWGAADSGNGLGTDCTGVNSTGNISTCNGDGDGNIEEYVAGVSSTVECYRAWQHLVNAGLIDGQFSGMNGSGSSAHNSVLGINVPKARLPNTGFALHSAFAAPTGTVHFDVDHKIRLLVGAAVTNGTLTNPVMTPNEAFNFDNKIDDGKPGTGNMMSYEGPSDCTTTANIYTSEYALSYKGVACDMIGQPGF